MKFLRFFFLCPLLLCASWNDFSHDLFHVINEENRIISPFSVQSALIMAYLGSCNETRDELNEILQISNLTIPPSITSPSIKIANSIWIDTDYNLLSSYKKMVCEAFAASIHPLSFEDPSAACDTMNTWIKETHQGKIGPVVEKKSLDANTRMAILNTLHIQDQWLLPFDKKNTKLSIFFGHGSERPINMMYQQSILPYYETKEMQATLLPFANDRRFAAVAVLPKDGYSLDMSALPLDKWRHKSVNLRIPRFKLDTKTDLMTALKKLGLKNAISNQADFSGITGYPSLKIDKIFTSSFIEINEGGICASAATGMTFGLKSSNIKAEKEFVANRPFGFMIIDLKTKVILFMGEVCLP